MSQSSLQTFAKAMASKWRISKDETNANRTFEIFAKNDNAVQSVSKIFEVLRSPDFNISTLSKKI